MFYWTERNFMWGKVTKYNTLKIYTLRLLRLAENNRSLSSIVPAARPRSWSASVWS